QPATIVGVMPESMRFPDNSDIWTPLLEDPLGARELSAFGRLAATSDRQRAQAELNGLAQPWRAADPEATKEFVGVRVETFNDAFVEGRARTMFLVMMGAVCFVLVIACANVANLLLARSVGRAREIAVRVSLGATRWRVMRQLLIESTVLSLLGGALGLWLAIAGASVFEAATQGSGKPYWLVFTVDYTVFGYVAAVCVLTAVLFGLAPALHVSKTNNHDVLKEGGRGAVGGRRARVMSGSLVVAELALTAVLLVGAGLMVRSFLKVYSLDIGIRTDHLLAAQLELPEAKYASPESRRTFFGLVEERLASIAGVDSVALTTGVPPFDGGEQMLEVEGQVGPNAPAQWVSTVTISPRFFDLVGAAILRGRGLRDADGAPGLETVVINDRLATRVFRGEDPVGRRLRLMRRGAFAGPWRTIVGVSPSIRQGSTQEAELNAVVYVPSGQDPPVAASFLIRSELPLESLASAVRRDVQAVDSDQPVLSIQTIDQMLADARWPFRTFGGVFALFGVIALTLSSVGLYGVMAYSVSQRTQEIGVRMALGASRPQVMWLVLARGLRHLGVGLVLGLVGALALSSVMSRVLAQIEPADPVTFGSIALLLSLVAIVACLLPARRATRVDPLNALRAE
ncbi:MAG: ADOP family duplicated permease, partial [Vicinamibacterales bacterium]